MSYLVLARKYRPRHFGEMVGQEHVVQALTNALEQQRLHHAYLFTGTRGVGKTTISRILAKSLNCTGADGTGGITATPCGQCPACTAIDAGRFVDYTELDAASNRGVDEVYIDLTHVPGGQHAGGRTLAQQLQQSIFEQTQLTCSIGVAPNKLLAKLASEFNKPNGISIVQPEDLQSLIWPLPCRKLNGIGPKADAKLAALGIHTLGELAACDRIWLMERFGRSYGAWLLDAAWGRDDSPVITHSEPVSISRETTFARDLHAVRDKAELGRIFTSLCERVAGDLQRKGYVGRSIGIKLRYADFRIATRNITISHYTADARELRRVAGQCLKRVDLQQPLRLLGVRVGHLLPANDPSAIHHPTAHAPMGETGELFALGLDSVSKNAENH